jgi:hypothetical protein
MATPFLKRLSQIARSPQGRKVVVEAKRLSHDPATRRKIDEARRQVMRRGRAG